MLQTKIHFVEVDVYEMNKECFWKTQYCVGRVAWRMQHNIQDVSMFSKGKEPEGPIVDKVERQMGAQSCCTFHNKDREFEM